MSVVVDAVASRYTIAGRCARVPGLKAALDRWRRMGYVFIEPTHERIDQQMADRRAFLSKTVSSWPGAQFPCLCAERYMHRVGSACAVCGMDFFNAIESVGGPTSVIWIDDYGTNGPQGSRMRCYFDGRDDEPLGVGPWALEGRRA